LSSAEQQMIDRAVSTYLRQMNDMSSQSFGCAAPTTPRYRFWAEAFLQMLEDVVADGAAFSSHDARAVKQSVPLGSDFFSASAILLAYTTVEGRLATSPSRRLRTFPLSLTWEGASDGSTHH
jgi:hypothetical protein